MTTSRARRFERDLEQATRQVDASDAEAGGGKLDRVPTAAAAHVHQPAAGRELERLE